MQSAPFSALRSLPRVETCVMPHSERIHLTVSLAVIKYVFCLYSMHEYATCVQLLLRPIQVMYEVRDDRHSVSCFMQLEQVLPP